MPWIDKYELEDKYRYIRKKLMALNSLDENVIQNLDMKNMHEIVKCQEKLFNQTKNKHDKLTQHFKNHRMNFLSYICGLFSCCINNTNLLMKPCRSEKLRCTESQELHTGAK